jgi:hypothetical protein
MVIQAALDCWKTPVMGTVLTMHSFCPLPLIFFYLKLKLTSVPLRWLKMG